MLNLRRFDSYLYRGGASSCYTSEQNAFTREFARFVPFDNIVFLVTFDLISVCDMLTFLHLITKSHFVRLRSDFDNCPVSVFAKVYLIHYIKTNIEFYQSIRRFWLRLHLGCPTDSSNFLQLSLSEITLNFLAQGWTQATQAWAGLSRWNWSYKCFRQVSWQSCGHVNHFHRLFFTVEHSYWAHWLMANTYALLPCFIILYNYISNVVVGKDGVLGFWGDRKSVV
jgi:hypothetical protein